VTPEIGFENAMLSNIDPPVWLMPAFIMALETAEKIAKFS